MMFARLSRRSSRAPVLALAAAVLTAAPVHATWSVVAVDTSTGQVAVGCATCLGGDIKQSVPLILVGLGAAAAQASVDGLARNRIIIWDELQKGTAPKDILDIIQAQDNNWGSRQFGIVDALGRRGNHTGSQNGSWAGDRIGKSGTIAYSIQGNVLTGAPVVDAAELALINTPGDLAEKMMAAMEAAASMGGDGRCSCSPAAPDSCGSPPPSFTKAAQIGQLALARIGDTNGICDPGGCANGSYYLDLNVSNQAQIDPDPVATLRILFDAWRASLRGRPDHLLSTKTWSDGIATVPGNGTTAKSLDLALVDWEGTPLIAGGAQITVTHAPGSAGLSHVDSVMDHGDGSYTVQLTAGAGQGTDLLQVVVNDGVSDVLLYPYPSLQHLDTLSGDVATFSASAPGTLNLTLQGPESASGREYLILASLGTTPGFDLAGVHLPLNFDAVLVGSLVAQNGAQLVNSHGMLAPDGSGKAQINVKGGGALAPLIGAELDFAMLTLSPLDFVSNPWIVSITP